MCSRSGGAVETEDAWVEAALADVFAAPAGHSGPEFDLEPLLRRARRTAGLPETEPVDSEGGAETSQAGLTGHAIVAWLVVAALVVSGGLAWHRAEMLDRSAAQRVSTSTVKPVRGLFSAVEVEELAGRITPSLVDVETDLGLRLGGAGTGIVLTRSGEVLTNNHVIRGARSVKVVTKGDQRRYSATVVGYDRNHDVALLKIQNPGALTPAVLGDSTSLRIDEPILGIGNAGGAGGKPIRAAGRVVEMGTSITISDSMTGGTEQLSGLLKVHADIREGHSGGPLVNEAGKVVGVNTAATVTYVSNVPNGAGGTGYAILIEDAMAIVQTIRAGRSTDDVHVGPTGILGIQVSGPLIGPDGRIVPGGKLGATVTSLDWGSPAQASGLRRGDTIVGIDGTLVDTPARLTAITGRHGPGDRLNVAWITKDGQPRSAVVTLADGPPA